MKILFFTPFMPGPPVFGGQRRVHGLMTALAKSHEVSLVSLVDPSLDLGPALADARQYCREIVTVPDPLHRAAGRVKRVRQLQSMLSLQSWEEQQYLRPVMQRALEQHLATRHYDIINTEFSYMGGYRFPVKRSGANATKLVLDEHNVEFDILRRTANATRFDRRVYNALNYRKLRREELRAWRSFDGVAFTSERDDGIARTEVPGVRTAVIPNGVDVDAFRPDESTPTTPLSVLFFGAINYFPNTDAVHFFVKEVAPLLARKHPNAVIRIVGPGAPPEVQALASERIQIVGFVEDLHKEIARATVVVAPLRIGGGTRLKIVEAMAVAKPIVSTTIGAEGIDVSHGRDILLADKPEDFAREIGRVLEDEGLQRRLGKAARETAEAHYSWSAAAQKLSAFYASLLG
ncbi:MAG: glycosyltransferase family 4 protein [Myxococcales bacterium]